ncbi:MAG: D-alanine--D-alanine ligase family protein [Thermodesulfobacteriota bacterium]
MHVLLIAGGWSNERAISLKGASQIHHALEDLGHEVTFFDLNLGFQALADIAPKIDFAFINLHGLPGEDGSVQALLQQLNIPFQGAGPRGSLLALNKALAKLIFVQNNLPTPVWRLIPPELTSTLRVDNFPAIFKPNTGGSSLGLEIIKNEFDLKRITNGPPPKSEMLLEEHIAGREMTCAVLGSEALPPILIQPKMNAYFDYKSKYEQNGAEELCPAPVSPQLTECLRKTALRAHNLLGLKDYSRTDFIVDEKEKCYILETNTLPGMTETSLVPRAAAAAGYDFKALIGKLIRLGLNSKKET